MSEKRIQRKHFLAALGATVVGAISSWSLFGGGGVKPSGKVALHSGPPIPSTDPRAVARSTNR